MKIVLAGLMLAVTLAPAFAEVKHDRKLEQAVMDIVATKMGDLRGGLPWTSVMMAVSNDGMTTASVGLRGLSPDGWNDGLAIATERNLADIELN